MLHCRVLGKETYLTTAAVDRWLATASSILGLISELGNASLCPWERHISPALTQTK